MRSIQKLQGLFDAGTYMRALLAIGRADGLRPVELDYLRQQADMLGVDLESLAADPEQIDITALRSTPYVGRMLVRDCIVLAHIDGEYSELERDRIRGLAAQLGIAEEGVVAIEVWFARYLSVLEDGDQLLAVP